MSKNMTKAEKALLESIEDILYEVQYAKVGRKTEVRKEYALFLLNAFRLMKKENNVNK
jgi:hypothetical protein